MPVPYPALIPLFGIGAALYFGFEAMKFCVELDTMGKPQRSLIDRWDEQLMSRNQHLTGHPYGQMDEYYAPEVFSRSDPVLIKK